MMLLVDAVGTSRRARRQGLPEKTQLTEPPVAVLFGLEERTNRNAARNSPVSQ